MGGKRGGEKRRRACLFFLSSSQPSVSFRLLQALKLTGLAQLQPEQGKRIVGVKPQFTNMTSPLSRRQIWNIDLCAVKGLIKMITYTRGINAREINRNFILDARLCHLWWNAKIEKSILSVKCQIYYNYEDESWPSGVPGGAASIPHGPNLTTCQFEHNIRAEGLQLHGWAKILEEYLTLSCWIVVVESFLRTMWRFHKQMHLS